jgi:putative oxidoreductase
MHSLSKTEQITSWICRVTVVIILIAALFSKFAGAEKFIYIFAKIGLEPWGRYSTGLAELIAAVSLLIPRFVWAGALIAIGVITGAMVSHLVILGPVVQGDGGRRFGLAVVVFLCSVVTVFLYRHQIPHPSWHRCQISK